jgi:hypothetical protein
MLLEILFQYFANFLKFNKSTEILKNSEKLHVIKCFLSLAALATILVCYKMTKKMCDSVFISKPKQR